MKKSSCDVVIVEHLKGFYQGCKTCRQILTVGKYSIGLVINQDGREFRYFLGDKPMIHCGEEKILIKTFEHIWDAESERYFLIKHLNEQGTTEGLPLKGFLMVYTNQHQPDNKGSL